MDSKNVSLYLFIAVFDISFFTAKRLGIIVTKVILKSIINIKNCHPLDIC